MDDRIANDIHDAYEDGYLAGQIDMSITLLGDEPCNFNDMDEHCGKWCEEHCDTHTVRECWKQAILERWMDKVN